MFEQAELQGYRAPKWALMARLMQKERLKSPQKSLVLENQTFLGIILAILASSHSEPGRTRRKKVPFGTWGFA